MSGRASDRRGQPLRCVSIRTDICAEKALDEALTQQRAFLAGITEAVGEGILVEDAQGFCVFANQEAARLLGCERDTLIGCRLQGRIVESLGPPDLAHSSFLGAAEPEPGWRAGRHEGVFAALDGRRLPVLVSVQPMLQSGAVTGTVVAFRDHSEGRRQRDALRKARAAADRASRAKSAFLANMSHEIRTPLNGVLGLARLALDEPTASPQLRRYLEGIVESAAALTELMADVLDLSKIEAGKLSIHSAEFDLHELLRSVQLCFRELAAVKGLELQLATAAEVPDRVSGDRVRVRQIVSNLLSNAIKFTSQGRVRLLASLIDQGCVRLAVEDTGIGIEADVLAGLFRPFVQADGSITREYGGSGLGLSICRSLARAMGGQVGAESRPGSGSVFWAELPLQAVPAAMPRAGMAAGQDAATAELSGMRVLLVEDNETNTIIASTMMQRWDVQVTAAPGGREALDLLLGQRKSFDLVLMDLRMPGMGGDEATVALRERFPAEVLPVVALTAAAFEEDRERCREIGMNDFVTKPVSAERLLEVLLAWSPSRRGQAK